jgi:hypothetical protein
MVSPPIMLEIEAHAGRQVNHNLWQLREMEYGGRYNKNSGIVAIRLPLLETLA